jgi:hypothetical protein
MPKDPEFLYFKIGTDGCVTRPHQKSQLRFVGAETLTWTSGIALPVLWSIFFAREHFTENGAAVDGATALALIARREKSLREKSSLLVERGLSRFIDWAKRVRADRIELDLRDLETWRHAPLLAALAELTKFIDDASTDPGPLPPTDEAAVGWRTRKGTKRLEGFAPHLAWPDEVPLLAHWDSALLDATLGRPPFRKGPWPEWRFAEDESAPLEPKMRAEIQAHLETVRAAIKVCPNNIEIKPIGNLEGVDRMRNHYRSNCSAFQEKARQLIATCKAFAEKHQVVDDTSRWEAALEDCKRWQARMEEDFLKQENDVRTAMRSISDSRTTSKEIDFDNFPSGDDPF